MLREIVVLGLQSGLQAREAADLAQIASRYQSRILLEEGSRLVNAKSMMGMMSLGLIHGQEVTVIVDGADDESAMAAMRRFLRGRLESV